MWVVLSVALLVDRSFRSPCRVVGVTASRRPKPNTACSRPNPDILIRRGGEVVHVIDTKWKSLSSRMEDAKQGVSQADVYQMMAYGQLYRSPRLTLLYPHQSGLGGVEGVHARHQVTECDVYLETASFNVADGQEVMGRLRRLLFEN